MNTQRTFLHCSYIIILKITKILLNWIKVTPVQNCLFRIKKILRMLLENKIKEKEENA
jgi:hypothetical protein